MGIETAHLKRQRINFLRRDIGGIGDDNVEFCADCACPVSDQERSPVRQSQPLGVAPRHGDGADGYVDADAACARQLGQEGEEDGPGSRAEVECGQRLIVPIGESRQSCTDDGLGIRPRLERGRSQAKWEAPEFPLADDPPYRLATPSTLGKGQHFRNDIGASRPLIKNREIVRGAAEHMSDKEARIKLRGFGSLCKQHGDTSSERADSRFGSPRPLISSLPEIGTILRKSGRPDRRRRGRWSVGRRAVPPREPARPR